MVSPYTYLREFVALHYERHPESMRTVPWLRPAGRDSVAADAADVRRIRRRVPNWREKNYNSFNNSRLKTRDKIKTIMELKFENNNHLKKALPEMLKFLLRPGNIFMSIKMLHENSDFIWNLSGDKSNDFSYYSKRGLLSTIYLATLIYWLNDKSEKDIATKNFISKSVDGIVDGVSRLKQLSLLKGLAENFMSRYAKKTS